MRTRWISLVFLISLALGSCGKNLFGTELQATSPETTLVNSTHSPVKVVPLVTPLPDLPTQGDSTPMTDHSLPADPNIKNLIAKAIEDLSGRLSIPSDQVKFKEAVAVIWPDSSLGCPQMGIMYTQVLTPGFEISLETNGKTYTYHTDDQDRVLSCRSRPGREIFLTP